MDRYALYLLVIPVAGITGTLLSFVLANRIALIVGFLVALGIIVYAMQRDPPGGRRPPRGPKPVRA